MTHKLPLAALAFACAFVGFAALGSHPPDAFRLAVLATVLFVVADVPTFISAAFDRRFPALLRSVSLLAVVTVALFAASPSFAMGHMDLPASYPPSSSYANAAILGSAGAILFMVAAVFSKHARATAVMACLSMMLLSGVAFAQGATPSPTVLPIQWGDMANGLFKVAVEALYPVVLAAVAYAAGKLPWWVSMWLTTQRIDRALQTGADYALNAVEGATAGKAISVDVGFTVLKVALERILGSTPDWLIKEMGGPKGISERLFRVFKFDESVSDKNTLSPLIRDLPTLPFAK